MTTMTIGIGIWIAVALFDAWLTIRYKRLKKQNDATYRRIENLLVDLRTQRWELERDYQRVLQHRHLVALDEVPHRDFYGKHIHWLQIETDLSKN